MAIAPHAAPTLFKRRTQRATSMRAGGVAFPQKSFFIVNDAEPFVKFKCGVHMICLLEWNHTGMPLFSQYMVRFLQNGTCPSLRTRLSHPADVAFEAGPKT